MPGRAACCLLLGELLGGRLAMLGFCAAGALQLATGLTAAQQVAAVRWGAAPRCPATGNPAAALPGLRKRRGTAAALPTPHSPTQLAAWPGDVAVVAASVAAASLAVAMADPGLEARFLPAFDLEAERVNGRRGRRRRRRRRAHS